MLRSTTIFYAFLVCLVSEATAAPIRLKISGEVVDVTERRGSTISLPFSVASRVELSFAFEPFSLRSRGNQASPELSGDTVVLLGPISARGETVDVTHGTLEIDGEQLAELEGKLLTNDNRRGGVCAGFFCSSWIEDAINLFLTGEARSLSDGTTVTTSGGLLSRSDDTANPTTVLEVGTDIGGPATWNAFDSGTFYLRFHSLHGERIGSAEVQILSTALIAEPHTALMALLVAVTAAATNLTR